ncbi:trehalose-phosphatase [Dongia sp.]|uniref:trehalose-phosphatase n=1 Tax=Dongia sp. TaxID=1977262 RepID=UPI0035B1ADFB
MMLQRSHKLPPQPENLDFSAWALFLDLDGTLLDIAASPESVLVPKHLIDTLARLRTGLGGALAILSGRPLRTIDRLLHPLLIAAGGEHGAVLRLADGAIAEAEVETVVPAHWRQMIHQQAENWPGVLVEEKSHGLALHYRADPALGVAVTALLEQLVESDPTFEILPALLARELRHRSINKGEALRRLMATAPFERRRPLFIGDDVTDEDAIAAADRLGGLGLRVADCFAGEPARVRTWLGELAAHHQGNGHEGKADGRTGR